MTTLIRLDSTLAPGLDGHVLADGSAVVSGDSLVLEQDSGDAGRVWMVFPGVTIPKYHRATSAVLRLVAAALSDAATLTVRACAEADSAGIGSAAELTTRPLTRSVEIEVSGLAQGETLELDLTEAVNHLLELFPATSQPRGVGFVIDVSAGGDVTLEFASGSQAIEADRPALTLDLHSVLNLWHGQQPEQATRFELTVERAVPDVLYEVELWDGAVDRRVSYRAEETDTAAEICEALAELLAEHGNVEYTEGETSLVFESDLTGRPTDVAVTAAGSIVEELQAGALPVPQIVDLALESTASGGSWTAEFDWGAGGESTAALPWNATATAVAAAVTALPTPQPGDVSVAKLDAYTWRVTLGGSLAGTQATVTLDTSSLTFTRARLERVQAGGETGPASDLYLFRLPAAWTLGGYGMQGTGIYEGSYASWQWRFRLDGGAWSSWANQFTAAGLQTLLRGLYPADLRPRVTVAADYVKIGPVDEYDGIPQWFVPPLAAIAVPHEAGLLEIDTNFVWEGPRFELLVEQTRAAAWFFSVATPDPYAERADWPEGWIYGLSGTRGGSAWSGDATPGMRPHVSFSEAYVAALKEHLQNSGAGLYEGQHYTLVETEYERLSEQQLPASGRFVLLWEGTSVPAGQDGTLNPTQIYPDSPGAGPNHPDAYAAIVTRLTSPTPIVNQIDRLTLSASGGTFSLTVETDTTAPITYPTTPGGIDSAIQTAVGGDVSTVTTAGVQQFLLEWVGAYAASPVDVSVDGSSLTGPEGTVSEHQAAVAGVNARQRITVDPSAFGGSLRFSDPLTTGPGTHWSLPVAWDAGVADLQAAGNGLLGSGRSTWTGVDNGGPWIVEFTGSYGARPLPLMRLDQDDLKVTDSLLSVDILQEGTGPNRWDDPLNWSLLRVPQTHDVACLADGNVDALYGLVQLTEFTVAVGANVLAVDRQLALRPGMRVRVRSTGRLPATAGGPLDPQLDYVVHSVSRVRSEITLATSDETHAEPLIFTDPGEGVHEVAVALYQFHHRMQFTGAVGLPPRDDDGVIESLPRFLRIGFLAAPDPQILLGIGEGNGSHRLQIDAGRFDARVEVAGGGTSAGASPPIQLLSLADDFRLTNLGGEVGLGVYPGERVRFRELLLVAGSTRLGRDVAGVPGAVIDRLAAAELVVEEATLAGATLRLRS